MKPAGALKVRINSEEGAVILLESYGCRVLGLTINCNLIFLSEDPYGRSSESHGPSATYERQGERQRYDSQ